VGACAVAELEDAAESVGEEALAVAELDDAVGSVEHDPFDVGFGQQRCDLSGGHDGAVEQLAGAPGQGLVVEVYGPQAS
jgi:hypothetical protein